MTDIVSFPIPLSMDVLSGLEQELQDRYRLSALEARVNKILVQYSELKTSLQHCATAILQELQGLVVGIWTYSDSLHQLELQGMSFAPHSLLQKKDAPVFSIADPCDLIHRHYLGLDHSLIGWIAKHQRPIYDYGLSYDEVGLSIELESALIHLVGYPLVVDEQLVGVLSIWREKPLIDYAQDSLMTLTQTLSIAIDRQSIKTALLAHREALLFRLANQIRNSLDLNTILNIAVQEIQTVLKVDYCCYLWCWVQGENLSLMVSHFASYQKGNSPILAKTSSEDLTPLIDKIKSLENLIIEEINGNTIGINQAQEREKLALLLEKLGLVSLLMLPVKTRSGHLGAIVCCNELDIHQWTQNDVELLQGVIDQLAIAIDQAELFAQARATALAAQTQAQQLQLALEELRETQTQLIQTEKMSSLGQMVAGIAHEINNPVNFINGNLHYISEYIDDLVRLVKLYQKHQVHPHPEIVELAEEIDLDFMIEDLPKTLSSMQVGANRIREIVVSLRNFSRLDQAERKPVDIHEGLESTLLILHNRLKGQPHRPEIKVIKNYGKLPLVECYAGQLNQVFMNILSNSIDALEDNKDNPEIMIETTVKEKINTEIPKIEIIISDNGQGMSTETVKRIFDPFFTTKPVGKGTGLGLSISYQIITERHGGTLSCQSVIGQGTSFSIVISAQPSN